MVEEEIITCDFCKEGDVYTDDKCAVCKKDICHACSRNSSVGVILHTQVWFDSSRDLVVCTDCYASLSNVLDSNPLLQVCMDVSQLRSEYNAWMKDFKQRMEAAEQKVKSLMNT
jgi:hypothetical protein